jgi:hypothetical protein
MYISLEAMQIEVFPEILLDGNGFAQPLPQRLEGNVWFFWY